MYDGVDAYIDMDEDRFWAAGRFQCKWNENVSSSVFGHPEQNKFKVHDKRIHSGSERDSREREGKRTRRQRERWVSVCCASITADHFFRVSNFYFYFSVIFRFEILRVFHFFYISERIKYRKKLIYSKSLSLVASEMLINRVRGDGQRVSEWKTHLRWWLFHFHS